MQYIPVKYTLYQELAVAVVLIICLMLFQLANTVNNGKVLGSPGSHLSESDFIDAISGGEGPDDVSYRLPEFVTSFLLAKDIEMEIVSKSSALYQSFMHSSLQWEYITFFSLKSNTGSNEKQSARTRVHKTSTGMKIKIPGAQVIGYYTQKIPRFPLSTT